MPVTDEFRAVAFALSGYVSGTYDLLNAADAVVNILPTLAPEPEATFQYPHNVLVALTKGSPEAMSHLPQNRIGAIKAVRLLAGSTHASLKATKDAVEEVYNEVRAAEAEAAAEAAANAPEVMTVDWERDLLSLDTAKGRVAYGAAFLDNQIPGWDERIDVNAIEQEGGSHCIVAQLYGNDYTRGQIALGFNVDASRDYGFMQGEDANGYYVDATELDVEWKALITERRNLSELRERLTGDPWSTDAIHARHDESHVNPWDDNPHDEPPF